MATGSKGGATARRVWLQYMGHNYIGHNYVGHNYVGHNYVPGVLCDRGPMFAPHRAVGREPITAVQSARNLFVHFALVCSYRISPMPFLIVTYILY